MTLMTPDHDVVTDPGALPPITQRLAFRIRRLRADATELAEVAHLRMASYARHGLELLPQDGTPQADEFTDDSSLLVAQRRADGVVLGTVRIQTNRFGTLEFERD